MIKKLGIWFAVIALITSIVFIFKDIGWTRVSSNGDSVCKVWVGLGSESVEVENIEFMSYDMNGIPATYVFRMKDFDGNIYTVVDDDRIAFRCLGE